jgi:hypothetical protein
MQFLLDKLDKQPSSGDALVYADAKLTLTLDERAGRAVLRAGEREAVLIRDARGRWAPEDWLALAVVLGERRLAAAALGF